MATNPNTSRTKRNNKIRTEKKKTRRPQMSKLSKVFDEHIRCEFEKHDVEAVMKTMVKEPYVHHVPVLTGGIGYLGGDNFFKDEFVNKNPEDGKFIRISRTV